MKTKNKSSILIFFLICIVNLTVWGQEFSTTVLEMYGLTPVNEKDVNWNIVQSEIGRITKSDPNSLTGNRIDYYGLINARDANSLFPNWKFYLFTYSMYKKNPADRVSLALGLKSTLAVSDTNSVRTFAIYNSIDYEEFLKLNKVSIHDSNDAELVWGAFCEISRKGSKTAKFEKVSDNEWKLGINSYEQTIASNTIVKRTNFYKVTTDPNTKQITDWKSVTETTEIEQSAKAISITTKGIIWLITFEPSGYASAQYGSIIGDSGYVPEGTVDFFSLLKKIESTPKKEKKEIPEEYQIAILYKGQTSTTSFALTDVSFIRDILLSLESQWKQMPLGTRFNELHDKYPIIKK